MNAVVERKPLREMDVNSQRREIAYHFLNNEGKVDNAKLFDLTAALNDHLNPKDVLRMWKSSDGTGLLYLIHRALVDGLEDEIDRKNEEQEDDE